MRKLLQILLFAAFAGTALAQDVAPDVLVRNTTQEVLGLIKQDKDLRSGRKLLDLVDAKVLPHFNFTRMTMLAVGRPWRDANPAQQQTLTREFRTLLVRTYSTALELYKNQTIDVRALAAQPGDTDVVVKTAINQPGGQPIPMDYRMEKTPQGWKVFDVKVGGVSLISTYREDFAGQVRDAGIDGLIKVLTSKNRQLESRAKS